MSEGFITADLVARLAQRPRSWLVTGGAGFIGSHLVEQLLRAGQRVTGLDNFSTGHRSNLDEVRRLVGRSAWSRHQFVEGDIADPRVCAAACENIDVVLHHAAIGSVPRSLVDPLTTHASNATGFLNVLNAARAAKVGRFVYAGSSSTYGDSPVLPKVEDTIGRPLSPYAVTKYLNELYADVFGRCYGMPTIGLRYFNVFGPRQDPEGAYAAVIPRWFASMLRREPCVIHGDGETSRDFCFVANVVQANIRAAISEDPACLNQVYNVAVGDRTTLRELHDLMAAALRATLPGLTVVDPAFTDFRAGDIRHSLADVGKAGQLLGYHASHGVRAGIAEAAAWYVARHPMGAKIGGRS